MEDGEMGQRQITFSLFALGESLSTCTAAAAAIVNLAMSLMPSYLTYFQAPSLCILGEVPTASAIILLSCPLLFSFRAYSFNLCLSYPNCIIEFLGYFM